jgi:hypothetical protein
MKTHEKDFVTFSPRLFADDDCANYWMQQVTLRLRREVCWCWHERGLQPAPHEAALPPFADKASAVLDMSRFWEEKQNFYLRNPTARYLTEKLDAKPPKMPRKKLVRGSFGWVVDYLKLEDVEAFVLALALLSAFDGSMGSVVAVCQNDQAKTQPTLALVQKLWDEPERILPLADPSHPLFRYRLIKSSGQSAPPFAEMEWDSPLSVPTLVANQLLFPLMPLPCALASLAAEDEDVEADELTPLAPLIAPRLRLASAEMLRIVPILGPKGSVRRETVRSIARATPVRVVEFKGEHSLLENEQYLNSLATLCWLRDTALFLNQEVVSRSMGDKHHAEHTLLPASSIPALLFLSIGERHQLASLPQSVTLPVVNVPALTHQERVACWQKNLGAKAKHLESAVTECARRFRYEKESIREIARALKETPGKITVDDLFSACRAELDLDIGELATRVTPRFEDEELILPHKQHLQFEEHVRAMQALTEVHYGWGTAKVWNEGGISVLFAGPPGTGKTMAAEILAIRLNLPMYRIDLSQVVNKYIGETEKNLKRVFDAADISDMILFFDEADSLFGRRTEVKDAHDRYANLEISYLLERMERFKGLAILATNRKKELDEAFLRRLRYIIDFPLPDIPQRARIWQQVIPEHADSRELDFEFLAKQFQLAGGNIRSIVFNACLQSAAQANSRAPGEQGKLTMREIIIAIKREHDKLNRTLSLEQFGPYAQIVGELESARGSRA